MQIPWFRHRFLFRRNLDRLFLDIPDALHRQATGRGHWPPYSLRAFVGGAQGFEQAGQWFVDELCRLGLLGPAARILDIGCGCGRVAYALATDRRLAPLELAYTGMDVDAACVAWCRTNITPRNGRFNFYRADCGNISYNPDGLETTSNYTFPHPDSSFDVVLLTSVFTHLLEPELCHYLAEVTRVLAPGGVAYATVFLYDSTAGAAAGTARHGIRFPYPRGHCAVNREDFPANAVAYEERFLRRAAADLGLRVIEPVRYGMQDLMILTKEPEEADSAELTSGWHALDKGLRWTERSFEVRVTPPRTGSLTLRFRFYLPEVLFAAGHPVRLSAAADGVPLPTKAYDHEGEYLYIAELDATHRRISIRFDLNAWFGPSSIDERELGLLVSFASPSEPLPRRLQPFQWACLS